MNYIEEVKTENIDLLISLFESENSNNFTLSVDNKLIQIEYNYKNGEHTVK